MKQFYSLLCIAFSFMLNAQIVNIPDANFKARLLEASSSNTIAKDLARNWCAIDSNNDGLIQQSEANNISHLSLVEFDTYYNIENILSYNSLEGIQNFSNLIYFTGNSDTYSNNNFSGLNQLEILKTLNLPIVTGCINLKKILIKRGDYGYSLQNHSDTGILDLSNLANLEELSLFGVYELKKVLWQDCTNLKKIDLSYCTFVKLTVDNLPNLEELKVVNQNFENSITYWMALNYLDIINCPNLKYMDCSYNNISSLNLAGLSKLETLIFNTSNSTYSYIDKKPRFLNELNINGCSNLKNLELNNSKIKELDLSAFPLLEKLYIENAQFEVLDLSNNPTLTDLKCSGTETKIQYLKLKNNSTETNIEFLPNSNLKYICCDTNQLTAIQYTINANNLNSTVSVSDNCTNFDNQAYFEIPDINFLNKLIVLGIDSNNDGKIQFSETNNISILDVSNANIKSIKGIENFKFLTNFNCSNNQIENISHISKLSMLENLNCSNDSIRYLNVSKLLQLKNLNFSNNKTVFIDLSKNSALTSVNASNNYLRQIFFNNNATETSIDFSNNPKLHTIFTDANQVPYFQNLYPNATLSTIGNFSDYQIVFNDYVLSDRIFRETAFEEINENTVNYGIDFNNDSIISKSEVLSIVNYNLAQGNADYRIGSYNGIEEFTNIEKFYNICQSNNRSIGNQVAVMSKLEELNISGEGYSTFSIQDFSIFPNLRILSIGGIYLANGLSYFDFNENLHLEKITIWGMPNTFQYLFAKNGVDETINLGSLFDYNSPPSNQLYVCVDKSQTQAVIDNYNPDNSYYPLKLEINSYCSFNPGGDYNTIKGQALFDTNNNGCDVNDDAYQFLKFNLNDGTNSGFAFANHEGNYVFYVAAGNYTLTPELENPSYFSVLPISVPINFADANNNIATHNFCVIPNGVHKDLEITLSSVSPARPGFDAEYAINYKNKGNQSLSGDVSVQFDDSKLDFVGTSVVPTVNTTDNLAWSYSNLLPFESRSIHFTLNVNGPMEIPAVNNDDVLSFTASISPTADELTPENNSFTLNQTVVGSYDPNDKTCLEGNIISPAMIGEYVHYKIRFENTGTYPAQNVVVKDMIDLSMFDINSLQIQETSHNCDTKIEGNKVEFIFKDIILPFDDATNDGYILYLI